MKQLLTESTSDLDNDDAGTSTDLNIDLETIKACQNENTGTISFPIPGNPTYINVGTQCCLTSKALFNAHTQTDESFLLNQVTTIDHPALSTHSVLSDHNYYADH